MALCLSSMSKMNYPQKLFRAVTYDSSMSTMMTSRKRLLSEQNQCCNTDDELSNEVFSTNKRTKRESLSDDSNDNNQHHAPASFPHLTFDITTQQCSYSPDRKRRRSLLHINSTPCFHSTTTTETMFLCQRSSPPLDPTENESEEQNASSIFVTCSQLMAYINSMNDLVIIDCGLPLRNNERRIKESFSLNINDRLSRKRLITRGLKSFLDPQNFDRLNQAKIIILYDDTRKSSTCSNSSLQRPQLSSILQCIFDQIKQHDSEKIIYVLYSPFEEFYQYYPNSCYSSSTNENQGEENNIASPSIDIDSYRMSEVWPGLYLGNAEDAKDLDRLKENDIKSIINISTNIPCYHEDDPLFNYLQLPCQDSIRQNILEHFDSTFEYIHRKLTTKENVLVHCQGGISRSPSFVIGYLMRYHSKTFKQAYSLVKEKREIINPNLNFHAQLTHYEQMIN